MLKHECSPIRAHHVVQETKHPYTDVCRASLLAITYAAVRSMRRKQAIEWGLTRKVLWYCGTHTTCGISDAQNTIEWGLTSEVL